MIRITINDIPPSVNHAYRHTRQGCFMTSRGKRFQENVRKQLRLMRVDHPEWPLKGRIRMDVSICFGDRRVRDLDNYSKITNDSLEGNMFVNDSQIDDLRIRRVLGTEKRIKIEVEEIGETPTKKGEDKGRR